MLALLILGLVGGLIMYRGLARRIERLEAELAALRVAVGQAGEAETPIISPPSPQPGPEPVARAASDGVEGERDRLRPPAFGRNSSPAPALPAVEGRERWVEMAPDPRPSRFAGLSFEQLVGGRLPIWVGGAALAVAGFYLVGLAIEAGLLAPPVRVALALLFGLGLIAISELAGRWRIIADDARVAQALAGAGIASLYAAAYLASAIYGLITPLAALVLMAAVTAGAIGLALRRGPPTAIMGLLGGFAAPLLATGGDAVVPLLVYLGLLSAGLFALAIRRGWLWLALATTGGSFVWMLALIARDASLAAGGFVLAFAAAAAFAAPAATRDASPLRQALVRGAPIAVGLIELAGLIPASGFGIEGWGLYLALSAGAIGLAWRDPRLTPLVAGALGLSLAALAAATGGSGADLPLAGAIGIAILFGGAGHWLGRRQRDGGMWAAIGAAALVTPFLLLHVGREALLPAAGWGGLALLLAVAPLHLAWRGRGAAKDERPFDWSLQIAAGTAALMLACAATDLLPGRLMPAALALIAAMLAEAGRRIGDGGLRIQAAVAAAVAWLTMLGFGFGVVEALVSSLAGKHLLLPLLPTPFEAARGLLLPGALLGVAAWRIVPGRLREAIGIAAAAGLAAGAYVLAKQPFAILTEADFVARGFGERMLVTQGLFAVAAGLHYRARLPLLARALAIVAIGRVLYFDLALLNPAWVAQDVGAWPVANLLTLHFALAAGWTALIWWRAAGRTRLAVLTALVAILLGGALLLARQAFHAGPIAAGPVSRSEFYAYSVAALVTALALLDWGARAGDRAMRIAALGLLTLVTLKVFVIDASALSGVLRAMSFLGLGVALIAIGWAYGRFLGRATKGQAGFSG